MFINICITHPFVRLKNANPAKQEQARLEVENAEDDLVQKTEVAITLMKTVLENVGHTWPHTLLRLLTLHSASSLNLSRTSTNLPKPSLSFSRLQPRLFPLSKARSRNSV